MTVFLIDVLRSPSVTILLGKRGEGKTASGMKFLEEANQRGMLCYCVGIPESKWELIPDYIIKTKNLNDVPDDAAVFIDEAYMIAHARESNKKTNRVIAKILGVARQKDWTLLFATHSSMKLDKTIIAGSDNQMFKRQTLLLARFERKEIKEMVSKAYQFFKLKKAQKQDTRKWAIIFSEDNLPDGPIGVTYPLPKFWTEKLSKAFRGLKITEI